MAREYEIEIEYIHFPLHQETPPEGQSLLDLFGGPSAAPKLEAALGRLAALAEEEGLPFRADQKMTYNGRPAQEVGKWAAAQGRGQEFGVAAFHASFAEHLNLSDPDVLANCAKSVGLDPIAARKVVAEGSYAAAVDLDWKRAEAAGVTGVPTFSIGGESVVGAQPYEVLQRLVETAGVPKRKS